MASVQSVDFDFKEFDYASLGSPRDAHIAILSQDDIESIKRTWSLVTQDKDELGIRFMISIFQAVGPLRSMWKFAAHLETEAEWRQSEQLKFHAKKLTNSLGKLIADNLEPTLDKSKDMLVKLGASHHKYGVICAYFGVFRDCVQTVIENVVNDENIFDTKAKHSWNKFILLVVDYMSIGLRAEDAKNNVQ